MLFASIFLASIALVSASPLNVRESYANPSHFPAVYELLEGNRKFISEYRPTGLLHELAQNGQHPTFLYFGCSDSRVSETNMFSSKPGTLFVQRSIANQYSPRDTGAQSALGYATAHLGIKHILVVGHYGCGGVAASIASPPAAPVKPEDAILDAWISPIRQLYETSTRSEIVHLREANKNVYPVPAPGLNDPGFRALVEENVKASVMAIANDPIIANHNYKLQHPTEGDHEPAHPVYIHGWVYDIATGEVKDLGVTMGPEDAPTVPAPSHAVRAAIKRDMEMGHHH